MIFTLWIFCCLGIGFWIADLIIEFKNKPKKIKFMTAKAALCMAFLKGDVLTIKTGFTNLGITNLPREVSRGVEQPFGVLVSRTRKEGKSRWGVECCWYEYRLNRSEYNKNGIEKMIAYINENVESNPKTTKQEKQSNEVKNIIKQVNQSQLF